MTSSELMDNFYDSLMSDERILTTRERELLTGLLQRAHAHGENAAVRRIMAQAVGETVAQRAYEALGESITRRLLEQQKPFYASGSFRASESRRDVAVESSSRLPSLQVSSPPGPQPPGPPSARFRRSQSRAVAVLLDPPKTLRADCLILDEFLAPAEMDALLQYTLERESAFQISEVIQPGAAAGIVDYDQRRSRVLMELGKHHKIIEDRIRSSMPVILARLGHETLEISEVEAQITASNDGDYFHRHNDNAQEDNSSREITFVYFFHREPKKFRGGELRIYDSRLENERYVASESQRSVVPQQNQIVFFASSLMHEITPVECASRAFADSRFTVNGWLHR